MTNELFKLWNNLFDNLNYDVTLFIACGILIFLGILYYVLQYFTKLYADNRLLKDIASVLSTKDKLDKFIYSELIQKFSLLPHNFIYHWNRYKSGKYEKPSACIQYESVFPKNTKTFMRRLFHALSGLIVLFSLVAALTTFGHEPTESTIVLGDVLLIPLLTLVVSCICSGLRSLVDFLFNKNLNKHFEYALALMDGHLQRENLEKIESEEKPPLEQELPIQPSSNYGSASLDDILRRIDDMKLTGATTESIEQIVLALQKEKEKQSTNAPEMQRKINDALSDLLRSITK